MEISVKPDIKAAIRHLDSVQRKQIPFATSQALTDTAFEARRAIQTQLPRKLKSPTPWTIRGVRVHRATKRRLAAHVGFINAGTGQPDPTRAKYMKYQIAGGVRSSRSGTIVMPKGVKLNKYGNIPRGKIKKLLQNPHTFLGTIKGVSGVWQRGHATKSGKWSSAGKARQTGIRLLARFEDEATYRPRFPMRKIVQGVARHNFKRNFNRRLASALRTAR